jgi:CHAT domain-containing protein
MNQTTTWLDGGQPPAAAEDGLLTADDVTGMDLLGTELVVLSACDTGGGEVRVGEGVYGLRRAFELAGARTIVMSLWKADDAATCALMTAFYDELKNGETRLEALRRARVQVRQNYKHPYYWGAFILQGDPGEMRWG